MKKTYRDPETVSADEVAELFRRYWHTSETRVSIEASYGVSSIDFGRLAGVCATGDHCERCGDAMVWKSRQGRDGGKARCSLCKHRSGERCNCPPCREADEAEHRVSIAQAERLRVLARDEWLETYGTDEYVMDALRQLSPSVRAFLVAAVESTGIRATFGEIADAAGVPQRYIDAHLARLHTMRLLFFDGNDYHLHPGLHVRNVLTR
jgi:hypothetical protein